MPAIGTARLRYHHHEEDRPLKKIALLHSIVLTLLFIVLALAINAVPAPTQDGGGGGGTCQGGTISCASNPPNCTTLPSLYLAYSNPQGSIVCAGSDFWVTLSISDGWSPNPYSAAGDIHYDPNAYNYSGWSSIHGGPGTYVNLSSPGHLYAYIYVDLDNDSLIQLHFTRRPSPLVNGTIDLNYFNDIECWSGGMLVQCNSLEQFCETATQCSGP